MKVMKIKRIKNMTDEEKEQWMNFLGVDYLPMKAKDYGFYIFLFLLLVVFPTWFVLCWTLSAQFDNMPWWITMWQ